MSIKEGISKEIVREGTGETPTKGEQVTGPHAPRHAPHSQTLPPPRPPAAGASSPPSSHRAPAAAVHCTGYGKDNGAPAPALGPALGPAQA